ncbi:hypothetical protein A3H16_04110 [Candidatus Kaiserbacteria bacterium RIFCSPLOWO2_12_FULL_53_8]|uniref:Uncharacterized protein n=2 Tax=Candidatus Kaiseribacteriota TaxID=1752734 RepID=A0A1F6CTI3_9BACT|nr:MAG: hypothetical protein A2851_05510 [Candidatus Kaiserbacteria bacterium RIFCSPHIGHO2_01_FULL_53_29]OGG92403.1 MAG: hypothetical protein A3H16_04110 [Candidatus Kaiserbacteria bacterium RIFCSPLOWO2_12_FULL_53_8]
MNKIVNGVNELTSALAGRSIRCVREMLAQALNIDPASRPVVDGGAVDEEHRLADGETLEFVKAAGEKGC